jgi:uncharacterized protein
MTMDSSPAASFTAFAGMRRVAAGTLEEVARAAKDAFEQDRDISVLVFDDATSEQVDLDFSVGAEQAVERFARAARALTGVAADDEPAVGTPRGPGRPRLGVVAREVTLLPRHWEWLGGQPGGASVALRKLVEQARKANEGRDRERLAQEAAYRFMSALAGNLAGFEEAIRALFAANRTRFDELVAAWPSDVGDYARKLSAGAFASASEPELPGAQAR